MPGASDLQHVIEHLPSLCGDRSTVCVVDGVVCQRVGRNAVWQITIRNVVCFATYCQNDGEFSRRSAGIALVAELARRHPDIAALQVELIDEDRRVIVVRRSQGLSVHSLLSSAYRIDRNPFRRRQARAEFGRALQSVVSFLSALHDCTVPRSEHLWDHRPQSVFHRATVLLNRLSQDIDDLRGLSLPLLRPPARDDSALVLGDPTFGNFMSDGERLACVDFEDLGIGDRRRDFVFLNEGLKRALTQWHYWKDELNTLESLVEPRDSWCALYEVEPQLLRVERDLRLSRRMSLRREVRTTRERIHRLAAAAATEAHASAAAR